MNLAKFSIDRPVTTLMFYIAIILLGVVSLSQLSVDLLPSISYPRLSIVTQYPGVAPEEVEALVTVPLETSVSRIPGLRRVESISKEGFSFITLEFSWGTDMDFALLHTRERLDSARDFLPEGVDKPVIIALDPQSQPIMTLALTGERRLLELKELAEELIKPRLEQVEGIAAVEITGGVEREIQVEVEPEKLANYGLQIEEVGQKIAAFNRSLQGGTIRKGRFVYSLRIAGEFENVKEIENIPIKFTSDGGVILLKHIGRVLDTIKEREGTTRLNGQESIGLLVRKEYGANTVKVTQLAKQVIEQIKKENPEINLEIISEQAKYIQEAIDTTKEEIIEGAILAFLTLLIFLQEWKSPLIIATVIPISIIGVFNLLFLKNITLNLMSLGGLALGVGMLDDTAVVVSESIFRHRQLGKPLKVAAEIGTKEVINAVAASVLTTIVVFLPVIYVQGVAGQLFKDTALTVTYTLVSALLVSVTLLPMLASRTIELPSTDKIGFRFNLLTFTKILSETRKKNLLLYSWYGFKFLAYNLFNLIIFILTLVARALYWIFAKFFRLLTRPFKPIFEAVFRWFNHWYQKFVDEHFRALLWSLDNKKKTFYLSVVFFLIIFGLGIVLPRELMPPLKTSTFNINLKTPVEYSFEQTEGIVSTLEKWLRQQPECQRIFSQVGIVSGSEFIRPDVSVNSAEISVEVKHSCHLEKMMAETRKFLATISELKYSVSREQTTLGEFLALTSGEVSLKVKGQDIEQLRQIALNFSEKLKNIPGIVDVNLNLQQGKPQLLIKIKKEALEKYPNLSPNQVAAYLVQAIRGNVATKYRELEKKYDVRIILEARWRKTIDQVLNSFFPYEKALIPIHELVSYELVKGPNEIRRENQEREIVITANLRGKKLSQVIPAIQRSIQELNLPADYRIVFGGEREEMTASFRSLFLAFVMAVILIYMIMAAQFESLLHPFLIMFTVPMGLVGTIILLLITGQSINAISIIGVIVLIGVVVDNAIVEIDYINQLRREGLGLRQAVVEGSRVRLRPIMMSTMSTITGLIPMALGLGRGAELLRPLAIAVIGGLTSSLFLTLILIPVLYEFVEARISRRKKQLRLD
ncbi:MAG: efflux RND transporter permease subunit [Candidatus Aminicenantes bacterium]|nr:efflux RND transporter permease subunit [Candidatus Aminicenantes bacterium]